MEFGPIHTEKALRSYLGKIGYIAMYYPGLKKHTGALAGLLKSKGKKVKKGKKEPPVPIEWRRQNTASRRAIEKIVQEPRPMEAPRKGARLTITSDANGEAHGYAATLCDGERTIDFMARKWQDAQRKYDAFSKELFALREATRVWRHWKNDGYAMGAETDNQALAKSWRNERQANDRIHRHCQELRQCLDEVTWVPRETEELQRVDALARYDVDDITNVESKVEKTGHAGDLRLKKKKK